MKIPKYVSMVMAVSMVMGSMQFNVANADTRVKTIVGENRIGTAVKISKEGWNSTDTVVLVNDSAIPDALTATPLAYAKKAPILLTNKKGLSKDVKDELKRLKAKNIIMIGGNTVLPSSIEKELKSIGLKTKRISGTNREETALSIAKELDKIKDVSEIAVVNGTTGLADAVSIASAAAERNMPVLLSNPKKGLSVSEKFIKAEDISNSYVIGGTAVLPDKMLASLPGMERVSGSNRNDTNAKVIERFYKNKKIENMYVAKDGKKGADQLIDALSVGALAAKNASPVLLVSDKKLSESQKNVINSKRTEVITQIGGKGNENAFNELKEIEKVEIFNVNSEEEYNKALKEADANDIIVIEKGSGIGNNLTITTKKAVTVEIKDDFAGNVSLDNTNADLINNATIGSLEVNNSNDTTITNNDKIGNIENNSSGTTIKNNGEISNPVTGTQDPTITGNKPGAGESKPNPTPNPEPPKPSVDEDKANIIKAAKDAAKKSDAGYSKTINVDDSLNVGFNEKYSIEEAESENDNKLKTDINSYLNNLHNVDGGKAIKAIKYDGKEYTWDESKKEFQNNGASLTNDIYTGKAKNTIDYLIGVTLVGNNKKELPMNIKASVDYIAKAGGYGYKSLGLAVKDNKNGTVELLKDSEGGGIKLVSDDKANLIIDLNGHTYTCGAPNVGSQGYETQGFHFEKENKVTIKNGNIKGKDTMMIFQLYGTTNLENLSIEGDEKAWYIMSVNNGNTTLTNVNIDGKYDKRYNSRTDGEDLVAIDVMHWRNNDYKTTPIVTVNNTSKNTINGNIHVYCEAGGNDEECEKLSIILNGGKYTKNPLSKYHGQEKYNYAKKIKDGYKVIGSDSEGYEIVPN